MAASEAGCTSQCSKETGVWTSDSMHLIIIQYGIVMFKRLNSHKGTICSYQFLWTNWRFTFCHPAPAGINVSFVSLALDLINLRTVFCKFIVSTVGLLVNILLPESTYGSEKLKEKGKQELAIVWFTFILICLQLLLLEYTHFLGWISDKPINMS